MSGWIKKIQNNVNIGGHKDKMSQRKFTNLRSIYLKIIIIISYHYIGHMYMFYTDKQFEGKITSSKINVTKKKINGYQNWRYFKKGKER